VVAEDEAAVIAQVRHQPRLLGLVERGALEVVVADVVEHEERVLRDRQKPGPLGGDRDAVRGVGVQHALGVVAGAVDRAVDDEAGRVDVERRVLELVAGLVDLDEAGGGDLVEEEAVGLIRNGPRCRGPGGDVVKTRSSQP
jgi:hypothetical protein